ncbi:antimicrobial ginkbilobin-2-like protein [Euphorbia lathyris]|uniref:antimicrobial ginkbilobin-2-like protein n=1 Tax=Euphorbia lathyris TaxID=212925 RepID=UPI00331326A8
MSNFSFYILISALVLQTVTATNPLFHKCSPNSQNITNINGDYQKSLNNLIYTFQNLAPANGFALGSVGQNIQDRPFGLSLCRGDISGTNCTTCIAEARSEIRKLCPYNKAATIWYDNCLLRYSDEDFFGQIDDQAKFYLINVNNVSDAASFNGKTKELLSGLAVKAYNSARMYGAGEIEIGGSRRIYGLAQCSRDLVRDDCYKCLNGAIAEIPSCCDGKQGGRVVVGASCTVRYEIYPFVKPY